MNYFFKNGKKSFSDEPFPEDSPTKRLLAYLNEQRQLNPEYSGAAGEEASVAPTEAPLAPPLPTAVAAADSSATVGPVDAAAVAAATG